MTPAQVLIFSARQSKSPPGQPIDNALRKIIVAVFLKSLPKAYKDEAFVVFHESCDSTDIGEAFAYFEGGMVYRLHSLRNQLLRKIT